MIFLLLPDRWVYGLQDRLGVAGAFNLALFCELMLWGFPLAMLTAILLF
jgi:hypothetical protein